MRYSQHSFRCEPSSCLELDGLLQQSARIVFENCALATSMAVEQVDNAIGDPFTG
jgi:hypothetical protein